MDPFTGMSQDEIKKLDDALQSDHAKAILQATSGKLFSTDKVMTLASGENSDVNAIMNTSIESLSSLSDLDSLEATINVPNDVDVESIVTADIFHDDLAKPFGADFALVDHTYSLPAILPKLDLLNAVRSESTTVESPKKTLELVQKSFDTDKSNNINSPPVRRSRRQLEKVERELKEKEQTNTVDDHLSKDCKKPKEVPSESFSPFIESTDAEIASDTNGHTAADILLTTNGHKSEVGVPNSFRNPIRGSVAEAILNSTKPLFQEKLLQKKHTAPVCSLNQIAKSDTSQSEEFSVHPPGLLKAESNGVKCLNPTPEFSSTKTAEKSKGNKERPKTLTGIFAGEEITTRVPKAMNNTSQKAVKAVVKNSTKINASEVCESKDEVSKGKLRRNSGKHSNKCLINEEKKVNVTLNENKSSKVEGNKSTPVKSARKKSLSFSEDKTDSNPPVQMKKRHLSVSEKEPSPMKNVPVKPKLKAKKKTSRSDSINADLLGPALFSDPDVMIKVKTTDDTSDIKKEKNTVQDKSTVQEKPDSTISCETEEKPEINELDLLKAEMQLDEKELNQDSVTVENSSHHESAGKNTKSELKPTVTHAKNVSVTSDSSKSSDDSSLKETNKDIKTALPDKQVPITINSTPKPVEDRPQRVATVRSQKCSPSNIKDFLVSKNKGKSNSVPEIAKDHNPETLQDIERAIKGGNKVIASDFEHSASSKKSEMSPKPERKSRRNIQRKRPLDEDYSPPEAVTRKRKAQCPQNEKNDSNQESKMQEEEKKELPKRETRMRASRTTAAFVKAAELSEEEEEKEENEEEEEDGETNSKDDGQQKEASGASEEEEEEYDSEDDPNKLWCICRKPHNNKFMIQCDKCDDWFHGTCVSVTRQFGRQLEKEGKEWICPNCKVSATKVSGTAVGASKQAASSKTRRKQMQTSAKESSQMVKRSTEIQQKNDTSEVMNTRRGGNTRHTANSKASEPRKEIKNTKSLKTAAKNSESNEKMLTRKPIPKDFVLKSRDPVRDKKKEANEKPPGNAMPKVQKPDANVPAKAEVSVSKVEKSTEPVSKSEDLELRTEKVTRSDVKQKSSGLKGNTEVSNSPGKPILLREITVQNNMVIKDRKVVAVMRNITLPANNLEEMNNEKFTTQSIENIEIPSQKTKSSTKLSDVTVKDTKTRKDSSKKKYECIACSKPALIGSVYCSTSCIEQYAAESVKIIQSSLKPNEDLNAIKVAVVDHQTGQVINGASAPTVAELASWLQSNQSFEVVHPTTAKKEQSQKIERNVESSKSQQSERDSDEAGKESVRLNVRKTLKKILFERCQNADDIKMTDDEVQKIATKIEEELNRYFKDNTFKYRTKYRSLMFNIKDPRNQGLFRKILKGKIAPDRLVRMSTEELASVELAKWREQENQHSLDMIKRMQIEQLQGSAGVRKKTHKGEIEIEEEAIGLDPEIDKEVPKTPPRPVEETIEVTPEKKEKKEDKETEKDTTPLHRSHLFDLNCKICTGKMAPPPPDEPAPKKIRVAHSISVEQTSPKVQDTDSLHRSIAGHTPLGDTSDDSIDREPSSTTHSSPDSSTFYRNSSRRGEASVWKGFIFMQDVAKFVSCAYKVSGPTDFLQQDIPDTIQVCGRIIPDQVWEYLSKIKQSGNKELIIICFRPANEEESVTYDSFYNYLNTRKRCGVVNNNYSKMIKDFYILPLAAHKPVPTVLMPFDGPGLPSHRGHLLLGILVRHRAKQKDVKNISKSVPEKTDEGSYTPPLDSGSYTPPLENRSYTPPLDSCTYTPPPEHESYTPPLEDASYTPPLDDQSYTPPIGNSPCLSEIGSSVPVYNPTRSRNLNHIVSSGNGSRSFSDDQDEEYEPSYTPPLEKRPKMDSQEDDRPYSSKTSTYGKNSVDAGNGPSSATNVLSKLMKRIGSSSTASSPTTVTTSVSSSSDLEREKMILNELKCKVKETDRKMIQSIDALKQLGATSSDIDIPTTEGTFEVDNIVNISGSGMSSFFDLPTKNLQDILNSVRPAIHVQEKNEVKEDTDIQCKENIDTGFSNLLTSTSDTDIRSFDPYSPSDQNAADSQDCSMSDVDERGSSQGGTPPPCDDEDDDNSTASELRPSDPRIKIRTNFEDDSFASGELRKSSLSDMSMNELMERAEKELEAIQSPSKNDSNVGQFTVSSWKISKEPPPPGIDPPEMPVAENVSFPLGVPAADSSSHSVPAYLPQPPLPESHVISPQFVPSNPPTPSAFPPPLPPPGFPLHTPPPNIDVVKAFPPPPAVLPPSFMPPPTVPPPPIPPPPPETVDQRDEHYYPWPPEGPPPDVDYRDRPPHWDERDWGDWDHRSQYDPECGPPSEYFHDREPEEWRFSRYERSFYPDDYQDDRAPWPENRNVRFEGRRPRRWFPRHSRGGRRDNNWRGRRRVFSHPPRE